MDKLKPFLMTMGTVVVSLIVINIVKPYLPEALRKWL